jgi:alginate O-acetyltransferase complex protein AlgI
MLFNSWKFFVFFGCVLAIYWFLDRKKQNILLIICSYLFYAAWDYRFTILLLGTTVIGYLCGHGIHYSRTQTARRAYLVFCVVYNLGTLVVFKYSGFFIDNFIRLLSEFHVHVDPVILGIVLPVGISFYNFHVLSYTIDLYRREIEPTPSILDFSLFVAFFPLLVAGPIERAKHLLPQIEAQRTPSSAIFREGAWLVFWGLWKKVFVAENLAPLVNAVFDKSATVSLPELYFAALAFAFQIYCDFSGYTDMARGCARLLGFDLLRNFDLPYFAANPSDFWKRWHISLSSWLRDYLYISLGGNRGGTIFTYRNLFLTMLIGGLWHGAAWNYVLWGLYQGLLLIAFHYYASVSAYRMPKWIAIPLMLQFTLLGWVLFRANRSVTMAGHTLDDSWRQIVELFGAFGRHFVFDANTLSLAGSIAFYVAPLVVFQCFQYACKRMDVLTISPRGVNLAFKALLLFLIIRYGVQSSGAFIYFQF